MFLRGPVTRCQTEGQVENFTFHPTNTSKKPKEYLKFLDPCIKNIFDPYGLPFMR